MATLIGMSDEMKGRTFELDHDEVVIGRRKENAVVLENASVSGRHCTIRRDGDRFFVRDLGSTNGTRLNSRDVNVEMRLRPKDILQVGSVEFMFDSEEKPEEVSPDLASTTRIEVSTGPMTKPESFDSISPFGARRREDGNLWYALIVIVGILALGAAILLFVYIARL